MFGYYDAVLGLIPTILVGFSGVLHVAGFETTSAITVSAIGAALIVGHAMFVQAPVDDATAAVDDAHTTSKAGPPAGVTPE